MWLVSWLQHLYVCIAHLNRLALVPQDPGPVSCTIIVPFLLKLKGDRTFSLSILDCLIITHLLPASSFTYVVCFLYHIFLNCFPGGICMNTIIHFTDLKLNEDFSILDCQSLTYLYWSQYLTTMVYQLLHVLSLICCPVQMLALLNGGAAMIARNSWCLSSYTNHSLPSPVRNTHLIILIIAIDFGNTALCLSETTVSVVSNVNLGMGYESDIRSIHIRDSLRALRNSFLIFFGELSKTILLLVPRDFNVRNRLKMFNPGLESAL